MSVQKLSIETACVNNAVIKLNELANRMRSVDFNFHDNDINNIDKVIEALFELDIETKRLHDELETETIKASVLRHRLLTLPTEIRDEIMAAVNATRQLNTYSQMDLQQKLDTINTNIVDFGNCHQELEKENSQLQPEKEQIRQQHEEIISQLNQRMAEKASMQIALNETRDMVREANKDIVELEDSILQLKEDLIQERTEARQEKKRLKKAVNSTADKTKQQKEENVGKKQELDGLEEKLTESELGLDDVRKGIRQYEASKNRLEQEENNLLMALSKEDDIKNNILDEIKHIKKEKKNAEKEYERNEANFIKQLKKLVDETDEGTELNYQLELRKQELQHEVKDKIAQKHDDDRKIYQKEHVLTRLKNELTEKAEDLGRLRQENADMEEQLENLTESHKSVVDQLTKQIAECRLHLEKERKERQDFQSKKDDVQKDLEETKTEEQLFMQTVNEEIQADKTLHVELSNEGSQLQKELKADESEIVMLQQSLECVNKEYEEMFETMHSKTSLLETAIISMEEVKVEKQKSLEKQTPVFEKLEQDFQERTTKYNSMKKNVVEMKNQKAELEKAIKKTKREAELLAKPMEKLQKDIKEKRVAILDQIKQHGNETEEIEKAIFIEGSKLKNVLEINHQLTQGIGKMQDQISEIKDQMKQTELLRGKLEKEIEEAKKNLVESWQSDELMQQFFATRDQNSVEEFEKILVKTENRATVINDVTVKLQNELELLTKFLDNLSSRRPDVPVPSGRHKSSMKSSRRKVQTTDAAKAVAAVAEANLAFDASQNPPSTNVDEKSKMNATIKM